MSVVGGDWRNGPAYDYFDVLAPGGMAHEFLRRNDEYAADYATVRTTPRDEDPPPALARWGLRFRGRPSPSRRQNPCPLAAGN